MEEMFENENPREEENREVYVERPRWQVWGARIALVLFIGFVIYQLLNIATAGLS